MTTGSQRRHFWPSGGGRTSYDRNELPKVTDMIHTMIPAEVAEWEAAMRAGVAPLALRPLTTRPWPPKKPRDPFSPAPSPKTPPPTDIRSRTLVADAIAWTDARAAEIVAWRRGQ